MFFTYRQNNSGGSFILDSNRGISVYVIVEAQSSDEADHKAEYIGLYFDGNGDCPCCGNRWTTAWEEGTSEPRVYGEEILPSDVHNCGENHVNGYVHYADNTVKSFYYK